MRSWAHYYDTIYYVLKRHLGFSHGEIEKTSIDDIMILIGRYNDEMNDRNIWEMSLRGFDPKKVPMYREHMERKSKDKKQASLKPEEAQMYKNIFDGALRGIRKGVKKNGR